MIPMDSLTLTPTRIYSSAHAEEADHIHKFSPHSFLCNSKRMNQSSFSPSLPSLTPSVPLCALDPLCVIFIFVAKSQYMYDSIRRFNC